MPKHKQFQMSGAKKRKTVQLKIDKERAEIASYPRLSRFLCILTCQRQTVRMSMIRRWQNILYWLRLILPLCRFIVICENDVCKAGKKTILEPLSAATQVAESECLQMKKISNIFPVHAHPSKILNRFSTAFLWFTHSEHPITRYINFYSKLQTFQFGLIRREKQFLTTDYDITDTNAY